MEQTYLEIKITNKQNQNKIVCQGEILVDNQKGLTYSWTFEKNENLEKALKDNMEIDVNLNLNILDNLSDSALDEKVTNEDKLIVSFEHYYLLYLLTHLSILAMAKYQQPLQC